MNRGYYILVVGALLLCSGCASTPSTPGAQVNPEEMMAHLGATIRPETLSFPDYLLMADFELDQHGWISDTGLVGAGMRTSLELATVYDRFQKALTEEGWHIGQEENGSHFFRLQAVRDGEDLELRAVRGTVRTEVFLLYRPLKTHP